MDTSSIDRLLRRLTASRVLMIAIPPILGLWLLSYFGFGGSPAAEPGRASDPPSRTQQVLSESPGGGDPGGSVAAEQFPVRNTADGIALERRILRARNAGAKRLLADATDSFRSWESTQAEWTELMSELTGGELGRVLATDSGNLPRLMELVEIGSTRSDELAGYREQLSEISEGLQAYLIEDPDGEITEKSRQAIESLRDDIRTKAAELASAYTLLRQHADRARGGVPGERTLAEAFEAHKAEEERQMLDQAVVAREQAKEEAAARLLEAERRKQAAETELRETELAAEAERLKSETEQKRIEAEKQREADELKIARAKLEAEFTRDRPEIDSLLSPFVSPAPYYLLPPASYHYSGEKTGLKLSTVVKTGALEQTDDGLDAMAMLGVSLYRPLGSFPPYNKSEWRRNPDVKRRLERAQELLLKYGDLLVEKGLME